MTVIDAGFPILRAQPYWGDNVLAQMWPGTPVTVSGALMNGTGPEGSFVLYRYINYEGMWGWADEACLL